MLRVESQSEPLELIEHDTQERSLVFEIPFRDNSMSTGNLRRADMKMEVVENDLQSRASSCNPVEKIDRFRIATLRHMRGFVPNYILIRILLLLVVRWMQHPRLKKEEHACPGRGGGRDRDSDSR